MRNWIGKAACFAAGMIAGAFLMQRGNAQENAAPGLRLNHVGVYAKDYNASLRFYTQTMGFREAFTIKDKDGNPTLTYLQINRDQFLELAPANAQRPAGLSHVGIWPLDLKATVAALRRHRAQVEDPRTGSTLTSITNVMDPNGIRLELLDFLPGSLPRKAIDEYK
jgi:catechol 2,3-dioxygenase-like lactoylglutathione lyase family enzyme